jgi:hypothetical protein
MNEDLLRQQLETALQQLDWSAGIPRTSLLTHLRNDPASWEVISRALADGIYFSPADVLTALPANAWQPPPPGAARAEADERAPASTIPFGRFGRRPDGEDGSPGSAPGVPDPLAEKTAAAAAVGVGLLALAGVALWVGRRLSQRSAHATSAPNAPV